MQDIQSSPTKVTKHPLGLPGKKIRLAKDSLSSVPNFRNDREGNIPQKRDKSPLGITLNTKVSQHQVSKSHDIPSSNGKQSMYTRDSDGWWRASDTGLGPAKSPLTKELSPFDREVPIVLSNQTTPTFPKKTDRNEDTIQGLHPKILKTANRQSSTPAIVLDSPTSIPNLQPPGPKPFARAASSIYTQAPSASGKSTPATRTRGCPRLNLTSIPPLPKFSTAFSSIKTPISIKSPNSATTESDINSASSSKDDSPADVRSKWSRNSVETVPPTPRRSIGWWNLILSPMEGKRLTSGSKGTPRTIDPDAPQVPVLDRDALMISDDERRTNSDDTALSARASLMSLPHRHTIPYVGAAALYYNPNETFGEKELRTSTEFISNDDDRHLSDKGVPQPREAVDVDGDKKDDQKDANEKEDPKTDPKEAPKSVPTAANPVNPVNVVEESSMPGHGHDGTVPTAQPHSNVAHPSRLTTAVSAPKHMTDTHAHSKSPTTPETICSPGVVQVADARHFQSARSVHTKTPTPPPRVERANFEQEETHYYQPEIVAPVPQRPVRNFEEPVPKENSRSSKVQEKMYQAQQEKILPTSYTDPVDDRFRFKLRKRQAPAWAKSRLFLLSATAALLFIMLLTIILCLTVTRHHPDMPTTAAWLNLTGYPALPTGIATIARPSVKAQSSCVSNADLWSCSLPKEQQADNAPNHSDQPNMRLEIRFVGDSKQLNNSSSSPLAVRVLRARSMAAMANEWALRSKYLTARDGFDEMTKSALPPAPSDEDQAFLGNTTDNVAQPFDGESTPFVISFLPTVNPDPKGHSKRANAQDSSSPNPFNSFPPPLLATNNTAAEADLLPYPSAQPLKLYNRGKDSEHYGFYSYFDRSMFLKLTNSSQNTTDPINGDGGSERQDANARCTWSQTRFLVQIWTKPSGDQQVTPSLSSSPNSTNTATDFSGSGTFPLPVTVTVDRHGGDPAKKAVYCYALDQFQRPIADQKGIVGEARGFGGTPVNPAPGPFASMTVSAQNGGFGGIDGGSGGCGCQWTNW